MSDITALLRAAHADKVDVTDELYRLLYAELRRAAQAQLRRQDPARSLDTTVVVHESYLRLRGRGDLELQDQRHFLGYAARVMRSVIVDLVRARQAGRRGGGNPLITLRTGIAESVSASDEQLLKLHEALEELSTIEPRLAKVVEMRYFAGMSEQEAADALGVSKRTAQRDWEKARLFLASALKP